MLATGCKMIYNRIIQRGTDMKEINKQINEAKVIEDISEDSEFEDITDILCNENLSDEEVAMLLWG